MTLHVKEYGYLSTYLPALSLSLSFYLPIYLLTYLPIYLSIYLPIDQSTYLACEQFDPCSGYSC